MKFLNPSMFYLLSTLPIVAIFYMLKTKRQDTPISSIYLWHNLLRDIQANTPWQRLKTSLLMILQLLLLLVLIIALASPAISRTAISTRNIVLIIDNSQSMGAMNARISRLDDAKSIARDIVERTPDNAKFSLISTSDRAKIIIMNSPDKGLVLRELENIKLEGSSTNISSAINIGTSIVNKLKDGKVYIISDGCFEKVDTSPQSSIEFIGVGQGNDNVAIRAASLMENPDPPHALQLFASVKNFSNRKKDILISIYSNGKLIDSKQLELAKRSTESIIFRDGLIDQEAIEIRLKCNDSLEIDNSAWALRMRKSSDSVSIITNGNLFLEQGIRAVSSARINVINPANWTGAKGEGIVIFDGFIPTELPTSNVLIVDPPIHKDEPSTFKTSGYKRISSVEVADPNHPILRFVDLSEIRIARLKTTAIPGWMRVVATGKPAKSESNRSAVNEIHAVIAAGEESGRRVVILPFSLGDSDLPLRITYPVLLSNIMGYLSPNQGGTNPSQLNIGESIAIKPVDGATSITVDYPDGHRRKLEKEKQIFQDTQMPGIYVINQTVGDRVVSEPYAVSLMTKSESDIEPSGHPELTIEHSSEGARSKTEVVDVNLWPWVAFIAIILLFVEGWVYVKGY